MPASLPRTEGSSSFRRSPSSSCSRSRYSAPARLARNINAYNRGQHRRSKPSPRSGGTSTSRASVAASRRRENVARKAHQGKEPSTKVEELPGKTTYTSAWALRLSWTLPSTRSVGPPFPKPNLVPALRSCKARQPLGAHRIRLQRTRRSHRTRACQTLFDR